MGREIKHNIRLERIMNFVADSEFGVSDEELIAEIREVESTPTAEAEDAIKIFREVSQTLENLNTQLVMLGHRISSADWRPDSSEYTNRCSDCGLIVRLNASTGQIIGNVLNTPCRGANHHKLARTGS